MRNKVFLSICISFLFSLILYGQCPDKEELWKRLIFLRDSSTASATEKLNELLHYEANLKACSYKFDSAHALLLQRIGATYFFEADYLKAAQYMQRAIDSINSNAGKSSVNIKHNIRNYYSLGWIYDSLNNVAGKMKFIDSCIAISLRYNSIEIYLIKALLARVVYFYDVGDYHRCIDYATICERYSKQYSVSGAKIEYSTGVGIATTSLLWKVNALLILKDFEAAERLLANKINECKKNGQENYLATIYSQLAEVYLQKKDAKDALLNYNHALKYATKTGYDLGCKVILNNMGYNVYFLNLNEMDMALLYCKRAFSYVNRDKYEKVSEVFESVNILGNIANIYVRKKLYDSAFFYYRLALQQIRPNADEASLLQGSGDEFAKQKKMHYLTGLLIDKGDAFLQQYKTLKKANLLTEAVRVYKVADQLLERIKLEQTELPSKLFWRANSRRLYENAIEACYLQSDEKTALYFFEKSRAVLLNDQLNNQRLMGEGDILKLTQLKKKILQRERELTNAGATSEQSTLREEIFSSKQELERLEQFIKTQNPMYYQNYLDTGVITLEYVQQRLLKKDQALLEIFSGDSAVYALQVTTTNCYLTKIDKPDFEATSSKYILHLSNPEIMNRDFNDFVNTSSHLYNLIFRQFSVPGNRIIISPDGQYFPFECLVTSKTNQQANWFLNDHAVSYAYSARFLMNDFSVSSSKAAKNFMGVAPVSFPSAFSLASLPGSDQSLNKISSYFANAFTLSAARASRSNFLQQFSKYRVIQLYTHASDSSGNNEPVIYFADSALFLSDLISDSKSGTSLIVLSACETGKGKIYQGEGVFSFNRGFAALGIPAAITNLWSVDNESTYRLTELFYKWLAKGLPTDVALQKAKLEFLQTTSKEKSMPCYWAGPVLVGKADTIELSKPYTWKWIAVFAVIGCIVFIIVRKRALLKRAKRKRD